MIKNLKYTLLILMLIIVKMAAGSHMAGADITYYSLGSGKYKIVAKIYRDCRGIPFSSPTFNSCGTYTLSIARTAIYDVTPTCSTSANPCNPVNTGYTGEGLEAHIYEATVDFNVAPLNKFLNNSSCCEVTFAIGQCCRNGAITTGSANEDFWATCMINLCNVNKTKIKTNSGPKFSNVPIGFLCCNREYKFNNGVIDTIDYDSMCTRLAYGLKALPKTAITYSPSFTLRYPMTPYCIPIGKVNCSPNPSTKPARGFYIDTQNGDFIFTPTKCDEAGVVVLETTEYRKDSSGNWLIVGKARRDIQLIVKDDCGYNLSPNIAGSFNNQVCEGDKICFNIDGIDNTFTPYQIISDTVTMTWNGGVPEATFTILNPKDREKTAQFCWQTKVGQAREVSYNFTVTASDNHCPKPAVSIRGFKIKVKPRANANRQYTNVLCDRFSFSGNSIPGTTPATNYKWTLMNSLGDTLFQSVKLKDTTKIKISGKYFMHVVVNNSDNCPSYFVDTINYTLPGNASVLLKDTQVCASRSATLNPKISNANAPYRYYWTRPNQHINGDTGATLIIKNLTRDSTIVIKVTDKNGCIFKDTSSIKVKSNPVVVLKDTVYAQQDLKASLTNSILKPLPNMALKIKWTVLKTPAGVNAAKVLNEDPIGSQQYWMQFKNITDTGLYIMQYCVADTGSPCETCDSSVVEIKSNTSSVFQMHRGSEKIKLWPNPLLEGSWIISKTTRDAQFFLYSSEGKLISKGEIRKGIQTTITADKLNPGIYHLVVKQNFNTVVEVINLVKW